MKIYVVGSSKNNFLSLDNIREKFIIDQPHEGDNIDFLNPWYCELTGLYYLWQNCNDEIVGLEHYRRYFWSNKNNKLLNESEINTILTDYDIIVSGYSYPVPWGPKYLIEELNKCTKNKVEPFLEVLTKKDEKLGNYFKNFLHKQWLYNCNCFIGPKKILDEWCEFFFDLITEFEKKCPIGPNTNTLRREGYFAEFLFGAWLEYKGYKIKLIPLHKIKR